MKYQSLFLLFLFFHETVFAFNGNEDIDTCSVKNFVHPGMLQNKNDLDFMRDMVLKDVFPWNKAFENLQEETKLDFNFEVFSYISVGAYNTNSIGGKDFSASAKSAFCYAIMWYITQDESYARKSIEILNAWSHGIWGFDGNNAKLNVGLFGQYFLNAAEILRYSYFGWKQSDILQFERMLRTIFYPTIKDFFTEANGNWDASMITTMMCMGIFLNDHSMFNRAVERFYRGEGNSGITKYIYPGGQCQETTRDWGHVQLGIGELAKAAQIAWTQGMDFYSVADHRLASGVEYAARFLLGHDIPVWGELSQRDKEHIADIYESIYYHYYNFKDIELIYSKELIKKYTRQKSSIGLLTAMRYIDNQKTQRIRNKIKLNVKLGIQPQDIGAQIVTCNEIPADAIFIDPGDSIQQVIDKYEESGKSIILKKGVHMLTSPLKMKSHITLSGEGKETILFLKPEMETAVIITEQKDLHDIIIRDMLIEGSQCISAGFDPNHERGKRMYNGRNREGIVLLSDFKNCMRNILLENVTIRNFTKNGIKIAGINNLKINKCDISDNGSNVVPGPGFHHNVNLSHADSCIITNNRFDSSLWGNGISIICCNDFKIANNEFARNKLSGIYCAESNDIILESNWIEGNDQYGIKIDQLMDGCENIVLRQNLVQNNAFKGVFIYNSNSITIQENKLLNNGCIKK